ncbi:MAG: hypothetical protein NTX17_08180 [Candidatus Eisenbacteria bacterium]|nr:hypothetical protein [Candidatus Eisenbacteria bacterium]
MTRRLAFFALTGVCVAFLFLAGCSESTKPRTRERESLVARNTPENVLKDLRIIYSVMDDDVSTPEDAHSLALKYRELFHPDFKFYFVPGDTPPGFPMGWWGRFDETAAFDSMMVYRAAGQLTDVKLSWSPAAPDSDNRVDPDTQLPLHPDWMYINVASVLLDLVAGQFTYRVSNGMADFWFAPDPADTTLWVIAEWQDRQAP